MLPLHGELLLVWSEGCGLHHNSIGSKFGVAFICACALCSIVHSMLLVVSLIKHTCNYKLKNIIAMNKAVKWPRRSINISYDRKPANVFNL